MSTIWLLIFNNRPRRPIHFFGRPLERPDSPERSASKFWCKTIRSTARAVEQTKNSGLWTGRCFLYFIRFELWVCSSYIHLGDCCQSFPSSMLTSNECTNATAQIGKIFKLSKAYEKNFIFCFQILSRSRELIKPWLFSKLCFSVTRQAQFKRTFFRWFCQHEHNTNRKQLATALPAERSENVWSN
jgi:hypothetical protein